jgi:hypothetical protein
MLNCIKNENKISTPEKCADTNLTGFTNDVYIKSVCFEFYGESNGPKCSKKNNYCEMCCRHYIGIKHMDKLDECEQSCEKIVNLIGQNTQNTQNTQNPQNTQNNQITLNTQNALVTQISAVTKDNHPSSLFENR